MKTLTVALSSFLLLVLSCSESDKPSQPTPEPEPEPNPYFEIIKTEADMTSYEAPRIWITIQNTSEITCYNVGCDAQARDSRNVIIDTGFAYFLDGGDIGPGETAREDAIFFKLSSHDDYVKVTYDLTNLIRD